MKIALITSSLTAKMNDRKTAYCTITSIHVAMVL